MEKVIPKLRFPEFDGNWTIYTLKDISEKLKTEHIFHLKLLKMEIINT